jgi:hypothetical protein
MILIRILLAIGIAAAWPLGGFSATPAAADEITPSQMAAALAAVASSKGSRGFDNVLPLLAEKTQNQLIRMRPDLHQAINDTVAAVALKLAVRRADLDNDVARVWAKAFTEDELKAIAAFFQSPAGAKYAEIGPRVVTDSLQAVRGWSDRLGEELLEKSKEELKKQGFAF